MTARPPLSARLRVAALACHATVIAGLPFAGGLTGVLLALPLLVPAPGLWRGRPYTYAWSSMLLLFYIAGLLVDRRPLALALAGIGAVEFIVLLLFVRARAVEAKRAAA
jgi:uncharacterized membrane protein